MNYPSKVLNIRAKYKNLGVGYFMKSEGGTCEPGQRSDLTGCTPASGERNGEGINNPEPPKVDMPKAPKTYVRSFREANEQAEYESKLAEEKADKNPNPQTSQEKAAIYNQFVTAHNAHNTAAKEAKKNGYKEEEQFHKEEAKKDLELAVKFGFNANRGTSQNTFVRGDIGKRKRTS